MCSFRPAIAADTVEAHFAQQPGCGTEKGGRIWGASSLVHRGRGPQVAPTKQLVSVRYSPEVLQYFKATGAGWQTRMNEALLDWVGKRQARNRSGA